jgi:hypothetical protein
VQEAKVALEARLEALLEGERARLEAALQLQHQQLTADLAQVRRAAWMLACCRAGGHGPAAGAWLYRLPSVSTSNCLATVLTD